MTVTAYIALGSNLGYRRNYLDRALQALQERDGIVVTRVSSYYRTAPVGGPPGQKDYLNAAAELQTELEPRELLQALLEIERSLGRVRREKHGPRTIDLDLLLYGDLVEHTADLTVPHPHWHERLFVLQPLAEIAPDAVHPILKRTARELLNRLLQEAASPPLVPETEEAEAAPTRRELAGLSALVTGSTSGIGRAIALELAAAGADVIVHGRRSREAAEAVAEQIRSQKVRSTVMMADLRDPDACQHLVQAAWEEWGGLDIWINNAGADTLTGEAADWPFERKLAELLAVDVTATMLLGRAIGQRMKANWGGVILNMGWDQAETGMEGESGQLFAAAKGAVMAFTKSLAVSLAPQVRVNCLAPGWIRTAWGAGASARWQERARREALLGRWGTPEDVAAAARWLVSPAAAFITGQIVRVNGGAVR
ncbi:MAG TPA: 2-amino-4-hydroxy-6-hydroxymethyldihydropteridine diphosphokinase [Gemmataceae bacterium]|nr:2-amino-4-hydroxy-6-hydroxymethyldihydropteridine diphosphokinase [Gemmataceae bacterium]